MHNIHLHKQRSRIIYTIIFIAIVIALIIISATNLLRPPEQEEPTVEPSLRVNGIISEKIPLYGLVEIDLNVTANFKNPFSADQVDITATIETPAGRTIHIPAFYHQDFNRKLVGGTESLSASGEPYWKVRFTPMETGEHVIHITLKDKVETVTSEELTFNVYSSDRPGFVRLSERDRHYFRFDNNQSIFFIGHDVCWFGSEGTYEYDEWFSAMNLSGEKITRIWMAPWAFGIEWKQLGQYDLAEAWRLDYVINKAEEKGIYIILCLMNHGQLQSGGLTGEWSNNPYSTEKGGPLEKPNDFWTNEEALELFERRLRYVVARWGYSTYILSWELWNEVELTYNYNFDAVARWHNEMAEYLRRNDPYEHLITTSSDPHLGGLDSMDFMTIHRYGPTSFKDIAGGVSEIVKDLWARYQKPILITEFGADWRWFNSPYTYKDIEGIEIHNGIWSSILSGSASSAMLWWWDGYIHPYNLYYHFGALSSYLDGIDPEKAGFEELKSRLISTDEISKENLTDITVYPSLGWARPEANRFRVNLDGTVSNITQLSSFVQGRAHPDLKNNPTFVVTFTHGGQAMFHVNSVATSGAVLRIYLNDSEIESVSLPDRDDENDESANEYNMEVNVSVPAGTYEIRLDNSGGDWFSLDHVKFTDAMLKSAKTRVVGLNNGTLALVWVQNRDHTWWNVVNEMPIEPVKNATVELSGFQDDDYTVEWWDTYDGEIVKSETVTASEGRLLVTLKGLGRDVALKIYSSR